MVTKPSPEEHVVVALPVSHIAHPEHVGPAQPQPRLKPLKMKKREADETAMDLVNGLGSPMLEALEQRGRYRALLAGSGLSIAHLIGAMKPQITEPTQANINVLGKIHELMSLDPGLYALGELACAALDVHNLYAYTYLTEAMRPPKKDKSRLPHMRQAFTDFCETSLGLGEFESKELLRSSNLLLDRALAQGAGR